MVYPPDHSGKKCTARVEQDQQGNVLQLQVTQCASVELQRAVEQAIRRAAPLPLPSDKAHYERYLVLQFVVPRES